KNVFILSFFIAVCFVSCRKKEDPVINNPPENNLGKLSFTFDNVVGNERLVLNDTSNWYIIESGDSLQITMYKYYVTNFVLHSDDGDFKELESYYLIDESRQETKFFVIDSIPKGKYNKVSFLI